MWIGRILCVLDWLKSLSKNLKTVTLLFLRNPGLAWN